MLYAKVLVGLPIEGSFDYLVPPHLENKVAVGKRVWIPFRDKKIVGYIITLTTKSNIKKIKSIYEVIDEFPVLDKRLLNLAKLISRYYFCYWGEAVELVLPKGLRKGKIVKIRSTSLNFSSAIKKALLIQDLVGDGRWQIYEKKIKEKLDSNQSVIFLVPEIDEIDKVIKRIKERFDEEVVIFNSKQSERLNLLSWQKVKNGEVKIAIGTRIAVFLPFNNLGLIIIDNENNPSYKEEQSPYYHTRVVSFMHADLTKAEVILSDISPSLESIYLTKQKKLDYLLLKRNYFPSIVLVDVKKQPPSMIKKLNFSYPFQEMLKESLNNKQKVLIFLNRKGFSTFIYCPHCRKILKCSRCDVNLVYHFKDKKLTCHYCNYKCSPAKICPDCNSSYIRYTGTGIEKLESRLNWLYPEAKIFKFDKEKMFLPDDVDFIISTDLIFRKLISNIDNIGVVSLDNALNRIDFRASERTFYTLLKLLSLNPKKILLQTELPYHYCFKALLEKNPDLFYREELKLRKELKLPPFRKLALVKLKGKQRQKVKDKTKILFKKLLKVNKDKSIKVVSYFANSPEKLRDNYIWQIMLSSKSVQKLNLFLKKVLKRFKPSGIIINVDID